MERVLVDTSAVLALLVPEDVAHAAAVRGFDVLRRQKARLVMTSSTLLETYALMGRRLGVQAAKRFRDDFEPLLEIIWVDRALHEAALDLWLQRAGRRSSLVDATSFVVAKQQGLTTAFAFDAHFDDEGLVRVGEGP